MRGHATTLWVLAVTMSGLITGHGIAAAADDELIVAVGPGYGLVVGDDETGYGASGTLSTWLGLTDGLWLGLSGGAFAFTGNHDDEAPSAVLWEVMGGLIAAFDVFRWVPYLEGQVGLVGAGDTRVPTARFGLGVDYQVTPAWFVGAVARLRPLADPLGSLNVTVGLRAGLRFEL